MVALHVGQVWWTSAYKPLRTRRHKSRRTLCQGRSVRACVHSVGMLCGYMPNSSSLGVSKLRKWRWQYYYTQWCSSRDLSFENYITPLSLGTETSKDSILASCSQSWSWSRLGPNCLGSKGLDGVADGSVNNSRNSSIANTRHGTTSYDPNVVVCILW